MSEPPMIDVRIKYVYRDVDRHGNERLYFWRKGCPKIRIRETPGTDAFLVAYKKLLDDSETGATAISASGPRRILPGTWRWLCVQYFGSAEFKRLDLRTQRVRRRVLELTFDEPIAPNATTYFGEFPLSRFSPKAIRVLRDRKLETPEAANERLKAIRRVFGWAISEDHLTANPSRDVPYFTSNTQGHHTWTIEEVAQFEAKHPVGTKARLALALLLYLGVRRSDVVLFGKQHVKDGWLKFTQVKNRNRKPITMEIPVLLVLQEIIDKSPTGDLTFLVTQFGRPFTHGGFGNWFRRRCNEAGLPHCSAHGLRKAGATIAAENGASEHQLMAIFGWLTPKQAALYTRAARQKKLAGDAMPLLLRGKEGT